MTAPGDPRDRNTEANSDAEPSSPDQPAADPTARAWADLERFAATPELHEAFFKALERQLAGEVTPETFRDLRSGVGALLPDGFGFLAWLARQHPLDRKTSMDAANVSPATEDFVSRVHALYGPELGYAWTIWREDFPNVWETIVHRVYQDVVNGDYRISITIDKMNRETVKLEGDPESIAGLASSIVLALQSVEDPAALRGDAVAELLDDVEELRALRDGRASEEHSEAG